MNDFNARSFASSVLYEDQNLVVIHKPPFVSSVPDRQGEAPSILSVAKEIYTDIQVAHRLDRETSGVMLLARNDETYRSLSMAFENRQVQKIYHAVTPGPTAYQNAYVDLPLRETKKNVMVIDRAGKEAITIFNTLENFKHFSMVECKPQTGRMHQIRIHLSASHSPIVGDLLYGGKMPFLSQIKRKYKISKLDEQEKPMFGRVALHASEIRFELHGEPWHFTAPYPNDLEVFVKLLRKYDAG